MSFLFVWQTTFQAPLVVASGALGFTKYLGYVYGNSVSDQDNLIAVGLVVLLVLILYRNIKDIGKISVVLWSCVLITMALIIVGGLVGGDIANIIRQPIVFPKEGLFAALGLAVTPTMYSYLGYYNVCHLGSEVKNPQKTIPHSMMLSIAGIGLLYVLMQVAIFSVLPQQAVATSPFVVSTFIQTLYWLTCSNGSNNTCAYCWSSQFI